MGTRINTGPDCYALRWSAIEHRLLGAIRSPMLYPTELQARPFKLIRYEFRGALFFGAALNLRGDLAEQCAHTTLGTEPHELQDFPARDRVPRQLDARTSASARSSQYVISIS